MNPRVVPQGVERFEAQGRIEARALALAYAHPGEGYVCVAQMTADGAEFYVARRDSTGYSRCRDEATETVRRSQ